MLIVFLLGVGFTGAAEIGVALPGSSWDAAEKHVRKSMAAADASDP